MFCCYSVFPSCPVPFFLSFIFFGLIHLFLSIIAFLDYLFLIIFYLPHLSIFFAFSSMCIHVTISLFVLSYNNMYICLSDSMYFLQVVQISLFSFYTRIDSKYFAAPLEIKKKKNFCTEKTLPTDTARFNEARSYDLKIVRVVVSLCTRIFLFSGQSSAAMT